jgi:hypothetical protein
MERSDLAKLEQLQDEDRRKDRIVEGMAPALDAMKELLKKTPGPSRKREAVRALSQRGISARKPRVRRTCEPGFLAWPGPEGIAAPDL